MQVKLTEEDRQAIRARVLCARSGPWMTRKYPAETDMVRQVTYVTCGEPDHDDCAIAQAVHDVAVVRLGHTEDDASANAAFIAAAREDVPDLLDDLDVLYEENERLRTALDRSARRLHHRLHYWMHRGNDIFEDCEMGNCVEARAALRVP